MKKSFFSCTILLVSFFTFAQEYIHLVEDFNNNDALWEVQSKNIAEVQINNGCLHIEHKGKDSYAVWHHYLIDPDFDYEIETSVIQTEGLKNQGFGIIWGHNNWDDYYKFIITSSNYFMINKKVNQQTFSICDWVKKKNLINPAGVANILKISKSSGSIKYYINNKLIYEGLPEKFVGTNVGFFVSEKMKIKVDYLKIKCKKTDINLIDNPNKGYQPENLGKAVNSELIEISPLISPDNTKLYFSRRTPDLSYFDDDIWYSNIDDEGKMQDAICEKTPLNNNGPNWIISITPDGNTVLLGNTYNKDGSSSSGISISRKINNQWQFPEAQEIKEFKNSDRFVNYWLTADQTKLIISVEGENTFGNCDLYVSTLEKEGVWSKPENLGPVINTFAHDFSPFMASDNTTLYFSSFGHQGYGSADIFMSKRLDDSWLNWSKPLNLGPEINSNDFDAYFSLSAKAEYAYMIRADKKTSFGYEDIYRIKMNELQKPEPVFLIRGKVFNKNTNELIDAEIIYENLSTSMQLGKAFSTKEDGFKIVLPKGANYGFRANAENFISVSENINLDSLTGYNEKEINLYLVPLERGLTITMHNIFFDFNAATLKKESNAELNRLAELMKKHKNTSIQITGHTDNVGTEAYNMKLSTDRALAVKTYLVNSGISDNRIKAMGLGESQPIESNETEDGRSINRRVEFTIL